MFIAISNVVPGMLIRSGEIQGVVISETSAEDYCMEDEGDRLFWVNDEDGSTHVIPVRWGDTMEVLNKASESISQ